MSFPKVGDTAPQFSLYNQRGELVSLADFSGKKQVLLYFYPKAATPGCTTQACGLRDSLAELTQLDTEVLGLSPDSPAKLQKFTDKYGLNFNLLADEDHQVAESYGVWGLKKFMGREFMGILRTSFIIDKQGKIKYVVNKVNTKSHHQDILQLLGNGI